jgi:hypothetical protein
MPIKALSIPNSKSMTIHLNKFVERVLGHEARGAQDFIMSMKDARDLHADITRLLLELNNLREQAAKNSQEQVITVQVGGGSF